jgi:hypothetical protein
VKRLFKVLIALGLVSLALPELRRYASERELYRLTAATQQPVSDRMLREISIDAESLESFPGDWRPAQLAGRASLRVRNPHRALDLFGRVLRDGERPEIDYDLGLAFLSANDSVAADAAFLRASWINPAIAGMLAKRGLARYEKRVAALEQSLQAGRLTQADLPPVPRVDGLANDRLR